MRTTLIALALVFTGGAVHAQGVQAATLPGAPGSVIEKAPEPNHDALNALPRTDIAGRVRVMQGTIDNSIAWMRRQRAAKHPASAPPGTTSPDGK